MTPLPEDLDIDRVRAVMLAAAEAAAELTLSRFRTPLAVENKWAIGFDPVTEADLMAETAIRKVIEEAFPEHGITGEEWDPKSSDSAYEWIIDPIDGTRAYISGVPVWGTLIGLTHRGKAIAGMMAQPFSGESWIGIGEETRFSHKGESVVARTSGVTSLAKAKLSTTSPELFTDALAPVWAAVRGAALQCRYGLDCYAYCLLASGHLDLVVEAGLKNVDIAPLIPVIEKAGGVVTAWDGGPAEQGGNCLAAATPELHAEAMTLIARAG
jgi:histidinol phosphatase-like enzyme (inositol monophosphatase family)